MSEYKVNSRNTKYFSLIKAEKEIGNLVYEKWFSFNAEINLDSNRDYLIKPKGFWGTIIELKQNDKLLLNFKMHWNGNIIIKTVFDETEREFVLKHKGILKSFYVLLDKNEQELVVLRPDFKWSKFNHDYNISTSESFDKFDFNEILLLTVIHCANYYMTMMSTVVIA